MLKRIVINLNGGFVRLGKITLKLLLEKNCVRVWIEFSWLTIVFQSCALVNTVMLLRLP